MRVYALAAWCLAGTGVGFLNVVLMVGSVRLMDSGLRVGSVSVVVGGYLLRYVLAGGLLAWAIAQGIGSALAAVLGLWLVRWVAVYVGRSGHMDRLWLR